MIFLLLFLGPALWGVLHPIVGAQRLRVWNLGFCTVYCMILLLFFPSGFPALTENIPSQLQFISNFFAVSTFVEYFLILFCGFVMFFIVLWQTKPSTPIKNSAEKDVDFSQNVLGGLFLSWAALIGLFTTNNALLLYVFWEFSVIPVFFSLLRSAKQPSEVKIALRFIVYTFFSSMFLLTGLLYLYWVHPGESAGLENFQIMSLLQTIDLNLLSSQQLQYLFLWMMFAVAVKIPFLPFHSWQPGTYALANLSTLQFTAALLGKMGIFLLLQWYLPIFSSIWDWALLTVFYPAAALTLMLGYLMAWREPVLMRSLAYYSMAHTALIFLAVVVPDPNAKIGGIFLIFVHGLLMVGLFAVAHLICKYQQSDTVQDNNIRNLNPILFIYFLLLAMAAIGLPLTSVFAGEIMVYLGVYRDFPIMLFPLLLGTVLGATVMLRLLRRTMWGASSDMANNTDKDRKSMSLPWNQQLFFILLIFILWILGMFPEVLLDPIRQGLFQS